MNVLERITDWGQVHPDRIAHISGDRSMTYGELDQRSNNLANYFLRNFVSENERRAPIAFYGHKEPEMLIAFLAAIKSGHPYVPIDTSTPEERMRWIVEISNAVPVLNVSQIAELSRRSFSVISDLPPVRPTDAFYIMFTSGSTGSPKGVVITHQNVESFLTWVCSEQKFSEPGEVFLDQSLFSFDVSVMDVFPCLMAGNTVFSVSREEIASPAELFRSLSRSGISTWISTPSFIQLCLTEKSFGHTMLPRLRRLLLCGETLSPGIFIALRQRFPEVPVWNMYGPTEATVVTTSVRIDQSMIEHYPILPVGHPKPGSRISIVGEDGRILPHGQSGEIIIGGDNVSPGYIGRLDLTSTSFFEQDGMHSYRTGDWGYMRDNLLFFEGRTDSQIKLRGHRIEIGDVETHVQALPFVRDAIVVPKIIDKVPEALAAFVILHSERPTSEADLIKMLRDELKKKLPSYMIPRRFYFLSHFPMTPNGKADRKKLAEQIHV